ncbi:hypothetical protein [Williamsia deligens]|uniref:Uncharacterized protein n=1 Tax=Williamsia deligens TaxID=321325 RepID=A0ABW3G9S6_9NOCA|nr:hypothetical protein [Williamsia deligens]MCP2193579.1 hypothetical protein [Williamsia deligens]
MTTPERGIRRARAVAVGLGVAALGAIGVTSSLAYADTHQSSTSPASTATPSSTEAGTDQSTGSDQSSPDASTGTGNSSTDWGTAPTVSAGSGDSHAQTNGS